MFGLALVSATGLLGSDGGATKASSSAVDVALLPLAATQVLHGRRLGRCPDRRQPDWRYRFAGFTAARPSNKIDAGQTGSDGSPWGLAGPARRWHDGLSDPRARTGHARPSALKARAGSPAGGH